jgi:hypothetical protein
MDPPGGGSPDCLDQPRAKVRGFFNENNDFQELILNDELTCEATGRLQSVNKLRRLPLAARSSRAIASQGVWQNPTAVKNCYRPREGWPPLPQNDSAVGKPDRQPTLPSEPLAFTSTK